MNPIHDQIDTPLKKKKNGNNLDFANHTIFSHFWSDMGRQ